jgi:serine/threonine-protein kinase
MSSGDPCDPRVADASEGGIEEGARATRARARLGQWVNGKWKLAELLGLGGTAAVYAATHRNGARVAIKMMHAEFTSDVERCARFQREGYAANLIQHPGVVSIHDDGVDEHGQPFLVMELLRGASLQSLLGAAANGMPPERVFDWALTLLEILERAHAKDVLHRDIKPSNLFLDDRGRLRVLDFGLAGGVAFESSTTTVSGSILGTPAFMPPEQARGDWEAVDARSDLWATGATLFSLLTGEHVHSARTAQEQLGMAMMVSPRSVKKAKPELSDGAAEIVDRALCFESARRWQSAREMASAVRRLGFACSSGHGSVPSKHEEIALAPDTAMPDQRIDTQRTATFSLEYAAKIPQQGSKEGRLGARLAWMTLGLALIVGVVAVSQNARTRRDQDAARAWKALPAAPRTSSSVAAPRPIESEARHAPSHVHEAVKQEVAPLASVKPRASARRKPAPVPAVRRSDGVAHQPSDSAAASSAEPVGAPSSSERLSDRLELEARE